MPKSAHTDAYAMMLKNLIAMRKELGVSQEELAERLGKKQPFVSKIERGERRLDVVEFYALARSLRLEVNEAFTKLTSSFPDEIDI